MKKLLLSLAVVLALAAGTLMAADVSGVWKASMPGRDGDTYEVTFNFKAAGESLTGTMSTPFGDGQTTPIEQGKVSGDTITFKVKREFQGNEMIMNYEGKVAGDQINFKSAREGSDRPPREFVAKRAS